MTIDLPRPVPEGVDDAVSIGPQMRRRRQGLGLTLAELSGRTGLSIGHLSQVERGLSTPTIRQLQEISTALGVRIGWFFRPAEESPHLRGEAAVVVRAGERRAIRYDGLMMTDFLLSPHLEGRLELLLCCLEPGAMSGDEPYSHEGEEAGLVLEGRLDLWLDEELFRLEAGDSFAFASTRPHRYRNPGRRPTRIVWVVTPPSF